MNTNQLFLNRFKIFAGFPKRSAFTNKINRMTTALLIEKIQKGDRKATSEMYDLVSKRLMKLSNYYFHSPDDVRVALQRGLYTLFKEVDSFRYESEAQWKSWCRKIIINECLNHLKATRRINRTYVPIEEDYFIPVGDANTVLDSISFKNMIELVNKIEYKYRLVFIMSVLEEYSHKEIGDALGMTENNSRQVLSRAKAILRKSFTKNGYFYDN